ncbi:MULTISPECIES: chemotaxis protein CheB [unclassified Cupriavidus]|uniref:chemotaxis protein CheB n=1 Tax=Cupriavidus sp. H19C3 TaxID=3241603 RepID=UPI003BF84506
MRDVIVLGGSRGAFAVLRQLAGALPGGLQAAVFLVLHIGKHPTQLAELLTSWGPVPATFARDGETWETGRVYVAPPDCHMTVTRESIQLSRGPKENFSRPAIDPLFRSAAVALRERVVGCILSGDLDDGAAGLAFVRAYGGCAVVQDPADADARSMPTAALAAAGGGTVVPARALAATLVELVSASPDTDATGAAADATSRGDAAMERDLGALGTETSIGAHSHAGFDMLDTIGARVPLTCPECGGTMWQLRDAHPLRFRCHTGHAFSALTLSSSADKVAEDAVWNAIRIQKEKAMLARMRAHEARLAGDQERFHIEASRVRQCERVLSILEQALSD